MSETSLIRKVDTCRVCVYCAVGRGEIERQTHRRKRGGRRKELLNYSFFFFSFSYFGKGKRKENEQSQRHPVSLSLSLHNTKQWKKKKKKQKRREGVEWVEEGGRAVRTP
jgi:hypothetical protein